MENTQPNPSRIYFIAMGAFWLVFGLIATFFPALMNMYQTEAGINAITPYSNHVWLHEGFDILSVSVLLFALSRQAANKTMIRAAAIVPLLVTIAIATSLLTTDYWNKLFLFPGFCCLAFSVWGFKLAGKATTN